MAINYSDDIQIKRIISRLRFHGVKKELIERVKTDINFEANYEKFLRLSNSSKSELVYDSLQFAIKAHSGQTYRKRSDSQGLHLVPYLNHPIILGLKALDLGFDEIVVSGCLVHDTFKATKISKEYLMQNIDPRICKIILDFNKLEGESKAEALHRILNSESYETKAIKILDKWHSLLRSFTLYDPGYQARLVDEVQTIVIPQIGDEFGDIGSDCALFIEGVVQLRLPILAN
jgi:(p)ppGpp synthase/HD superfamily hydrolase